MLWIRLVISSIVLGVFNVSLTCCNPIPNGDGDMTRECVQYDFPSTFNFTINNKIVVVYNSALCKRCMPKLLAFKALQLRFEIADFNEIMFILLTTEHSGTQQFAELQSKAGDILVVSLHDIDNDFFVAGSVYIFDKCSRLTYELFPPWSEIQYQWVKAAILSTWYDATCGKCEEYDADELADFLLLEKELTTTTDSGDESSSDESQTDTTLSDDDDDVDDIYHLEALTNDTDYKINLRTIIPLQHVHRLENNSYIKYNYIVFNSDNSSSSAHDHQHLENDEIEVLYDDQAANVIDTNKTGPPEYLRNGSGLRFKVTLSKPPTGNITQQNIHKYLEVKEISDVVVVPPSTNLNAYQNITNSISSSLAMKLRKWLSYRLLSPFYKV